jgi:acetyl-CoA synthetase
VKVSDLTACGVDAAEAASLAPKIAVALRLPGDRAWDEISHIILRPEHPFALHRRLFERAYREWDSSARPAPAWTPSPEQARATNVGRMMRERGLGSVAQLHAWSIADRAAFWAHMIERLGIRLRRPYDELLDLSRGVEQPRWLAGAKLNIAESCFAAPPDKPAVVYHDESGSRRSLTYGELEALSNRVAGGLLQAGLKPGDAVAIDLPMNIESVAAYLGIIKAGLVVVSIADSLAAQEIAVRLRLSNAKAVITQDSILRGGKQLPLYAKVVEAGGPRAIVIATSKETKLRAGDVAWDALLADSDQFAPHVADPQEHTNILFSSGTTGEPKSIPWAHTTPIKCAVDGYLHQDIQGNDVVAWPTNLGWMMGPWLIYASLVNRATMALYGGAPTGGDFGQFVQDAKVTMLGVIPSLVKTWRATDCMHGLDWSAVRRFSSTGECSNTDDMLFLMSLAGYKPVIEYCGGTELAGGYIGSTMAGPNVPSAFSTPSFGTELCYARGDGGAEDANEIFLVPPAIGMSSELLHHDHHEVYFATAPRGPNGETLRRHGDAMERLPGGYYRAGGRVDDTMNLGGIKVSSVEIERVVNAVDGINESAAIAVTPDGGGPSELWLFAVLDPDAAHEASAIKIRAQQAVRKQLNPLFKVKELVPIEALPRTASHKIIRRKLRNEAAKLLNEQMAILRNQAG